jgi:hypothetical protein
VATVVPFFVIEIYFVVVILISESILLDKFIFRKMAQFDSPVKLCPSGPKKSRNGIQWEKWIICQSSYTELLISMRSRIKASLLISMTKNGTTADTKINILNKNYQQQTRSNKIDI